jgi:Ser/Thr protein kinase RdoA (MazF antagonist)
VFNVKTLPDNPSLDHLHQQAKDLLTEMRTTRPDATLSDALASLAYQYGYRTWADLKAEVDRRRATLTAGDPARASEVADAFGLGRPTGPMLQVERAWAGQVWSLETDEGRWSATELFEWIDLDGEVEVALVEAAIEAGVIAPKPVRDTAGAVVSNTGGSRWRVHEAMKLGPAPAIPAAPATAAAVGRVLATLHQLALPAPGPIALWLTYRRPDAIWQDLLAKATSSGASWAPRLAEVLPDLLDLSRIPDGDDLTPPAILSHCGLGLGSVRMRGQGKVAIVGWDHAGPTSVRWEVGGALAAWGAGIRKVNKGAARALLDAYRETAPAIGPLDLTIFTSTIAAWLNWTATRIGIALNDDTDEQSRAVAQREVPRLLAQPMTRAELERVLDAVNSHAAARAT